MTKLNQKILQLIQESSGHLNATEVFLLAREKGIDVSLSSTYRILNSLYEKGYKSQKRKSSLTAASQGRC